MLTGRTPFAGESVSETFANLINTEPQPLSRFAAGVPDELQRIVSKMLRKNADERYQTIKDVLVDLKNLKENPSLEEKLLTELVEKNPTDEGGQFASFKALLSASAGNADQAEREIRDAVEKGKGFGHFHHAAYIIACAYAALNKPEEAVRFLQMAADDGVSFGAKATMGIL